MSKLLLFMLADFGFYFSRTYTEENRTKVKLAVIKNYSINSEFLNHIIGKSANENLVFLRGFIRSPDFSSATDCVELHRICKVTEKINSGVHSATAILPFISQCGYFYPQRKSDSRIPGIKWVRNITDTALAQFFKTLAGLSPGECYREHIARMQYQ